MPSGAQKRRAGKPHTLRARLVVASVVLIAVVCAVIGPVTVLITTVDKDDAYFVQDSDIAQVTAELRRQ
ncbi:hypothetical protein [Streptomyces sp. MBT33]|uniref:hypothetical protein n=1 Tax=Streptomyces sp. MBT33 TaxID=1488363 RepID=UPI00190CCD51|nr:hypothetical protein [Streptomyces sp. MBT33]MBK3639373.1 hypothetical protein [Streptomyces sp. MBT33]